MLKPAKVHVSSDCALTWPELELYKRLRPPCTSFPTSTQHTRYQHPSCCTRSFLKIGSMYFALAYGYNACAQISICHYTTERVVQRPRRHYSAQGWSKTFIGTFGYFERMRTAGLAQRLSFARSSKFQSMKIARRSVFRRATTLDVAGSPDRGGLSPGQLNRGVYQRVTWTFADVYRRVTWTFEAVFRRVTWTVAEMRHRPRLWQGYFFAFFAC